MQHTPSNNHLCNLSFFIDRGIVKFYKPVMLGGAFKKFVA